MYEETAESPEPQPETSEPVKEQGLPHSNIKLKQEKPTYAIIQLGELFPVFLSSLVYNGGEAGRDKKEAEQLAARAVTYQFWGLCGFVSTQGLERTQNGFMHVAVNTETSVGFPLRTDNVPTTAIPETSSDQLSIIPAVQQPFHEFKKPILVPSYETITPPIVFVPPVFEQPLGVGPSSVRKP